MLIRELWSADDEASLRAFEKAVVLDDLARAHLAIEGVAGEAAGEALATLDGWAQEVKAKLGEGAGPREQAAALKAMLDDELGFRLDDGGSPDGALLTRVLATRAARPTLLAALWSEVAARAGIKAKVAGLAGRLFLVIGERPGALVDPAAGGELVSVEQVLALNGGLPAPLQPVPPGDLLAGSLNFLLNVHQARGEMVDVFRLASFVCALQPQAPSLCLQKAAAAEQVGALDRAEEAYRQIAERFPGTRESLVAVHRLQDVQLRETQLLQ